MHIVYNKDYKEQERKEKVAIRHIDNWISRITDQNNPWMFDKAAGSFTFEAESIQIFRKRTNTKDRSVFIREQEAFCLNPTTEYRSAADTL